MELSKGLEPKTYAEMFTEAVEIPLEEQENNWGFSEYMGLGLFFEDYLLTRNNNILETT